MSKKTIAAYEYDKVMFDFVGENCETVIYTDLNNEYEAIKSSLDEINSMIFHFQDVENAEEVAFWRRFLMHNKMRMREIKKMMDANYMAKEFAYS